MKSMYTYALVAALVFGAQLDAKKTSFGKGNTKTAPKGKTLEQLRAEGQALTQQIAAARPARKAAKPAARRARPVAAPVVAPAVSQEEQRAIAASVRDAQMHAQEQAELARAIAQSQADVAPVAAPVVPAPVVARRAAPAPVVNREEETRAHRQAQARRMQEQALADAAAPNEQTFKRNQADLAALRAELTAMKAQNENANHQYFQERAALEKQVAQANDARQHSAFAGGQAIARQQAAEARAQKLEQNVQEWALEVAKLEDANAKIEEEARFAQLMLDRDLALKAENAEFNFNCALADRNAVVQKSALQHAVHTALEVPFVHKKKIVATTIPVIAAAKYRNQIGEKAVLFKDWMAKSTVATKLQELAANHPDAVTRSKYGVAAAVAVGTAYKAYQAYKNYLARVVAPAPAAEVVPAVAAAPVAVVPTEEVAEVKPGRVARAKAAVTSAGLRTAMAVYPHLTAKNAATVAATAGAGYYGFRQPAASQAAHIGQTVLHAASGTAAVKAASALVNKVRGTVAQAVDATSC